MTHFGGGVVMVSHCQHLISSAEEVLGGDGKGLALYEGGFQEYRRMVKKQFKIQHTW